MILQTILMLVALTSTSTTGGLETMFDSNDFMGINMDPLIVIGLSILISLKNNVMIHVDYISKQKEYFPFGSSFFIFCWGLFATLRRLLSSVAFFTPSLGLFSILTLQGTKSNANSFDKHIGEFLAPPVTTST